MRYGLHEVSTTNPDGLPSDAELDTYFETEKTAFRTEIQAERNRRSARQIVLLKADGFDQLRAQINASGGYVHADLTAIIDAIVDEIRAV